MVMQHKMFLNSTVCLHWNSNTIYHEPCELHTYFNQMCLSVIKCIPIGYFPPAPIIASCQLMQLWQQLCNKIEVCWEVSDQTRYAPSQWETSLHCNDVSHWLGTYLDWSLGGMMKKINFIKISGALYQHHQIIFRCIFQEKNPLSLCFVCEFYFSGNYFALGLHLNLLWDKVNGIAN